MDVLADVLGLRHRIDHVGREVVRVRRGEPDPPDPHHAVHLSEEASEQRPPGRTGHRQVPAVRVDVLAQQRDLHHAVRGKVLDLGEDLSDRSRPL